MLTYRRVSGCIFALVAVAHAVRDLLGVPVLIGDFTVPVWASWLVIVGGIGLAVWAFRGRD